VTELEHEISAALDTLSPACGDDGADWGDALSRGGVGPSRAPRARRRVLIAAVAAVALAAAGASPLGQALVGGTFDRLTAWIGQSPGTPAPSAEQQALREANARAAAPIPSDAELGSLTSARIDRETFDLFGFRDRGSLCLRIRSTAGTGEPIVKAPADCVSQQLLVDLRKPIAVVAAANPFPRRAKPGLQALYGLAADGVASVELRSEGGVHRVPVENNAFLYLYQGEGPRQNPENNHLEYRSDVPSKATALDERGGVLGSVPITSLKRGVPAPPPASSLPGPTVIGRDLASPHVGWLDRGEDRGDPFLWQAPDGSEPARLANLRSFHPNETTSMRVLVGRSRYGDAARPGKAAYCVGNVWPLAARPIGLLCSPTRLFTPVLLASAETEFDAQFPFFYGLVADGVASLELFFEDGARETVPIVDNVYAFQAPSFAPVKVAAYDADGHVVAIRMLEL
jgi:hypothetical protein